MRVVATAGHVDHGKSTLVRVLTGVDPDRWDEEKRRGLTIDLGFAATTLPSGAELAFVDVPGHVRFLRNMLAGVGSVRACLFVVAATEGWKPQSEEHLRILEVLGVRHGVVALTKVDAVDDDRRVLAGLDVADRLRGSFLEAAPVVEVGAPSGVGVDDLRAELDRLLERVGPPDDLDRPRLWVDRSFSRRGAGTVVTGTLSGGRLAVDDRLAVEPGGHEVRVRTLHAFGRAVEEARPDSRTAVNLAGVDHRGVGRGDALVRPGQWHAASRVDASLTVLRSLDHDVSARGAYLAYLGSGEHAVRVRLLGVRSLRPGSTGAVRLHLPTALPLLPGDRYVLREAGRDETIGGGEVLDVDPVRPAAHARPDRSVERVVAERGFVAVDELERLTGVRREPDVGRWVAAPPALQDARQRLAAAVEGAAPLGLDLAALDERDRALLATLDGVDVRDGRVVPVGADDPLGAHPFVEQVRRSLFAPPPPDGVDPAVVRALLRRGELVERDGVVFAAEAVPAAADVVARLLAEYPDGVTVSHARDALGITRKHALPLLGLLDAAGLTRRRGDLRVAGPRLGR